MEGKDRPKRAPNDRTDPRDDVVARASPVRCPFCHEHVEVEADDWCVCRSCLARHHVECWGEAGACAVCGERDPLPGQRPRAAFAHRGLVAGLAVMVALMIAALALAIQEPPPPEVTPASVPARALPPSPTAPEVPEPETPRPAAPRPEAPRPEAPRPEAPRLEAPRPEVTAPEPPAPPATLDDIVADEFSTEELMRHLAEDQAALARDERPAARQALDSAERLFMQASASGAGMWDYRASVAALRELRPKAAVPLMIRALHERGTKAQWIFGADLLRTIRLLTGWTAPDRYQDGLARELAETWEREKVALEVSFERMPEDRLHTVIELLVTEAGRGAAGGTDDLGRYALDRLGRNEDRRWSPTDLHARMVPVLLDMTSGQRRWAAMELLVALRRAAQVPQLDEVLADSTRPAAQRLAAALIRWKADGALDEALLAALARDAGQPLDVRGPALIALGRGGRTGADVVLEALQGTVRDLRLAALQVAGGVKDPRVEAALIAQLDAGPAPDELAWVARALAAHGRGAAEPLARALEASLERGDRSVYDLLSAFSDATGHRVIEAGAHDPAYYQARARDALAWWRAQPR